MQTFEKLVNYRIQLLGEFYNGKRGEEINISKSLSESETKEIEQAIKLRLIKQTGGDNLSTDNNELNEVKEQLKKANEELNRVKEQLKKCENIDSIINDIHHMKQKNLREKYKKVTILKV
jgi:Tfp pilus assembly protein PilO